MEPLNDEDLAQHAEALGSELDRKEFTGCIVRFVRTFHSQKAAVAVAELLFDLPPESEED